MIGADAVDPGINVFGVDIQAGGEGGLGRGDALGFPGEAGFSLCLGLGVISNGGWLCHLVDIADFQAVL
jgi:hypothetical protein